MRKIHISESQLNYLLKHLNEADEVELAGNVEQGKTLNQCAIDATKKATANGVPANKTKVVFSGQELKDNNITESNQIYTKRELKEARKAKLIKESKSYTKKDIEKSFKKHEKNFLERRAN